MGFLIGIGDDPNEQNIEKCAKDITNFLENLQKALEEFKKKKPKNIINAIKILIVAVKEFIDGIKPCAAGLKNFEKLIKALMHPDVKKIALKIATHIGKIIGDLGAVINNFKSKNFKAAGTALGAVIKVIFL